MAGKNASEIGCYDLHIYCANGSYCSGGRESTCPRDRTRSSPAEVTGVSLGDARNNAKKLGWKMKRSHGTTPVMWWCPDCVREGRGP